MQSLSEQPLVGRSVVVTTLITAAKETKHLSDLAYNFFFKGQRSQTERRTTAFRIEKSFRKAREGQKSVKNTYTLKLLSWKNFQHKIKIIE